MKAVFAVFILIVFYGFLSCGEDESPGTVTIELQHHVGGEDLVYDHLRYSSPASHLFSVIRLKYYISDLQLVRSDGYTHPGPGFHYCDVFDESSLLLNIQNVAAGDYQGLRFTFGLDSKLNVKGMLPNTTTHVNMEWPIPGDEGYHYMKFEGKYTKSGTGETRSYNLHTGSTGGNSNYFTVDLPFERMKVNGTSHGIAVQMDLLEWLQNPHVYDFETFGPMIMRNQEAQQILKENGSTVFQTEMIK